MEASIFDLADYIETPEDVIEFLNVSFEDGDSITIPHALNTVVRSKGFAAIARETGLSRTSLYRAFGENGNPRFSTVMKVLASLGLTIQIVPAKPSPRETICAEG